VHIDCIDRLHLANLALAIGVIVHLITYIVPSSLIDDSVFPTLAGSAKFGLAILPNVNLWCVILDLLFIPTYLYKFYGKKLLKNGKNCS
jgi:hypothetical protein